MTLLQFNKPALSIPNERVESIIGEPTSLIRVILKDGKEYLGYKINF